jgi:choline dehydrogenase-like flavoprotein
LWQQTLIELTTNKTIGGTAQWAGASLPIQDHEFRAQSHYGDVAGANLLDWPITLKKLEPYYDKAEDKMGVTRTNGIPGLPGNNNFKVMSAGAMKLGYGDCHTGRMAINSRARDGRPHCRQLGFCFQGCKMYAKWSIINTEIPHAELTGKLDLRSSAHVLKIEHDDSDKASAVLYVDDKGVQQKKSTHRMCRR